MCDYYHALMDKGQQLTLLTNQLYDVWTCEEQYQRTDHVRYGFAIGYDRGWTFVCADNHHGGSPQISLMCDYYHTLTK